MNADTYTIATMLDPHFKNVAFRQNAVHSQKARDVVLAAVEGQEVDAGTEESTGLEIGQVQQGNEELGSTADGGDVDLDMYDSWEFDGDQDQPSQNPTTVAPLDVRVAASAELDAYLREPLLPRLKKHQIQQQTVQTLQWWATNRHHYPNLASVARCQLAIPPSSAESERLFSAESQIVTDRRSRLTPENAQRLLFIERNFTVQ